MRLSKNGLEMIKEFEVLELHACKTPNGEWIIGYNHTDDVGPGQVITEEKAEDFLRIDLTWAEHLINTTLKVEINQNQFDSLVSFGFSCGTKGLKDLISCLNKGQFNKVSIKMKEYTKNNTDNKSEILYLTKRRKVETELFDKVSIDQEIRQR